MYSAAAAKLICPDAMVFCRGRYKAKHKHVAVVAWQGKPVHLEGRTKQSTAAYRLLSLSPDMCSSITYTAGSLSMLALEPGMWSATHCCICSAKLFLLWKGLVLRYRATLALEVNSARKAPNRMSQPFRRSHLKTYATVEVSRAILCSAMS